MRLIAIGLFVCGLGLTVSFADAQPPGQDKKGPKGDKGGKGEKGGKGRTLTTDELVAQMLTFDKNADGKLAKDEVTDARLHRLFDRADANKDGVATKEELAALFTKEASEGGGPKGKGGPPKKGPGGN
jgi:hypothetical protein